VQGSGQHSKCVNLMDINQENYRQGSAGRSPAYLGSKKKKEKNNNATCFPPRAMIMLDF